jgi:hypothetical protein
MKNADIGKYLVLENGSIVSKRTGRSLRPKTSRHGYQVITYYSNEKRRAEYVHRLVAMAFIHNPLNLREVNHIDGNKKNNSVANLEWCSRHENMLHAHATGLQDTTILKSENNGRYKGVIFGKNASTGEEVRIPALTLCREYGFNSGRVSRVISCHELKHKGFIFWRGANA